MLVLGKSKAVELFIQGASYVTFELNLVGVLVVIQPREKGR
jgi:hypothetical protein